MTRTTRFQPMQNAPHPAEPWHGTTILTVRKRGTVAIGGDGQVSIGQTVVKANAKKVRRLAKGDVIGGFAGATADAFHMTGMAPEGEGCARAMNAALKSAGISPDVVDYVNAHASSTQVGDRAEARAVLDVLGPSVPVSGTKGMYGHPLLKQNGAPVRLVVPWKYGFKSAKSLVRIELTREQPKTFWNTLQPREYGFSANVNPEVPHPRWSQARERMLGTNEVRATQLYNGYGEWVAKLYPEGDRSL